MGVDSSVINSLTNLLGTTVGPYSTMGVSSNQNLTDSLYSLAKQNVYLDTSLLARSITGSLEQGVGFENDATNLDDRHKISIFSRTDQAKIVCPIQEPFDIKVSSEWRPFISAEDALGKFKEIAERTAQFAGRTLHNRLFSRRIWAGTSPIEIMLPLKFFAVNSSIYDVLQPVVYLFRSALPTKKETLNWQIPGLTDVKFDLLEAPGPSPFAEVLARRRGKIDIYFGTFARFQNVIISEVSTTFDHKKDRNGFPVSAVVKVVFQTYEMWTAEEAAAAFYMQGMDNTASVAAITSNG